MPGLRIHTMLFPGGKRRALTLSYDDGVLQDRRLVEMMDRYGVRGTFNLNSGLLGRKERMVLDGIDVDISTVSPGEVPALYKNHEVATHGVRHTALTSCGAAALREILEDRAALEALVPYPVRGHAYPFGLYDDGVLSMLRAAGICYARTVRSTHAFDLPGDFLTWDPTCHHGDPELMALAEQFCTGEALFGLPRLFYLWGHAYEFDMYGNWDVMESFLAYVSGYRDRIWMASNGEIFHYVSAWRRLVYTADGRLVYNPTDTELWLEWLGAVSAIPAGGTAELEN